MHSTSMLEIRRLLGSLATRLPRTKQMMPLPPQGRRSTGLPRPHRRKQAVSTKRQRWRRRGGGFKRQWWYRCGVSTDIDIGVCDKGICCNCGGPRAGASVKAPAATAPPPPGQLEQAIVAGVEEEQAAAAAAAVAVAGMVAAVAASSNVVSTCASAPHGRRWRRRFQGRPAPL